MDSPDGPAGWFVYYAPPGKHGYVLSLGATKARHFDEVLKALLADAWGQGCVTVKGQAIPQYLTNLTDAHAIFRQPYACVIGHSRNPEIMAAFHSDAALSRLDAGAWLRFSTEAWG